MIDFEHSDLLAMAEAVGHDVHESPLVIAMRNEADPDAWNDYIIALLPDSYYAVIGTVDPGKAPMFHMGTGRYTTHKQGAGRISYGYYNRSYSASWHSYKHNHPCLRQVEPVNVERYQMDTGEWLPVGPTMGHMNIHRASFNGLAETVGHFSHGCICVRSRISHWALLRTLGYPEHGPRTDEEKAMRWSLLVTRVQY